ncbi:DUF881 domain-containing protein [Nakamurella deserti]|uniref:DUF881 domain-containing protein n=1 Tax=Nakamurella deserti TaxID=2164074 RepID=UPI000DBE0FF3|nr:DUF881 domain-containing protein [Nakamurella deserti]
MSDRVPADATPAEPAAERPGPLGPRPSFPAPLLESLAQDHLDPGYQRAADRRRTGGAPARVSGSWLLAGTVVIGLLLGVAFQTTRANSAGVDEARLGLLGDVSRAQADASVLEASVVALNDELRSVQAAAGGGALASLTALEQMNALLAVTGPGLRISLNDPEAATGNGAVLDRDIQLLVNGLWSAGAEAVAIGGVRLRSTSAIRQAGGAILVDNRPVLWPMTIEAIGDPATFQQRFVSTPGFGRFSSFEQLYDVDFEVSPVGDVSLPAAAAVDARYVEQPTATTTAEATTVPESGTAGTGTTTPTS